VTPGGRVGHDNPNRAQLNADHSSTTTRYRSTGDATPAASNHPLFPDTAFAVFVPNAGGQGLMGDGDSHQVLSSNSGNNRGRRAGLENLVTVPPRHRPPWHLRIVSMSFQLAIPWRVALQQSPPPLHQSLPASTTMQRLAMLKQRIVIVPYMRCLSRGVQSMEPFDAKRGRSPFNSFDQLLCRS
jgi:hypothetical protein